MNRRNYFISLSEESMERDFEKAKFFVERARKTEKARKAALKEMMNEKTILRRETNV
ncbi:hypothetical protein NO1_0559 [Candidatus Termititenax aidoneus]|uniref:Uncharacterized protein n=1 Tax=Termititenax aidoneus TaxID=2218524 RepID=A0A388T9B0_TERA1|nr:hypothetical protein NO1_0559 [Candidatus Termititenax aidoneus]